MKNILTSILAFGILTNSIGQVKEQEIKSNVKSATVYLTNAQVTRSASVSLNNGVNEIVLTELSQYINPNSIQAKLNNSSVVILGVSHRQNYLNKGTENPRIEEIQDSLEDIDFKLKIRETHRKVYTEEKDLLLKNKAIGGENTGVDIEDLMDMADFYRERLQDLETKLLDISITTTKLQKEQRRLKSQLKELNTNNYKYTGEIIVKLSSKGKQTSNLTASYMVNNAGWVPRYDIRSTDLDKPIDFSYKADVYQNTGVDWKNINITLSTGNPNVDHTQPTLTPWYLSYYNSYNKKSKNRRVSASYGGAPAAKTAVYEESNESEMDGIVVMDKERSKTVADFTTITESVINTEFVIGMKYDILSNGKANSVNIQDIELPVGYSYLAIPKKDKDAFLMAELSGWGNYNLLPGDANIYFEGSFVGESYIDPNTTDDTLQVSMGRDQSVVIKREKIDELCKNTTFGGNKKSSRGYKISVRNNKSTEITLELKDQIPLSRYKEIEVEVLDKGGATYNEITGELIWKLTIPAGETVNVLFKFEVKYPKEKNISNL